MTPAARDVREAGYFEKTWTLVRKDLRIELRARDTLPPMVAFAVAVTLLLAFAIPSSSDIGQLERLPAGAVPLADVLAGFLWVTVLFGGLIGFARTFEIERTGGALDSLLLVPIDRSALFIAKGAANLAFLLLVEALLVPVFFVLFGIDIAGWMTFALVVLMVDVGFVAIGTLFAAISAGTRSRELMLPVLALPALVPVFIAGVALTSDLLAGASFDAVAARGWFGVLAAFDLIFGIVGAIAFDFVLD